jgi:hypothetical protein
MYTISVDWTGFKGSTPPPLFCIVRLYLQILRQKLILTWITVKDWVRRILKRPGTGTGTAIEPGGAMATLFAGPVPALFPCAWMSSPSQLTFNTLKTEAEVSIKTWSPIYQTTWCHTSEVHNFVSTAMTAPDPTFPIWDICLCLCW